MDGISQVPQNLLNKLKNIERLSEKTQTAYRKVEAKQADQVDLSQKSKEIFKLSKAYTELPDVNLDKVNYFRQQIQSGDYKPLSREVVVEIFDPIVPK